MEKNTFTDKKLTYVEIDLKAIDHNLLELQKLTDRNRFVLPSRTAIKTLSMPSQYILAVVKANAYGHGAEEIALRLEGKGIGFFGVSDVAEGIELRNFGITKPILLFESPLPEFSKEIVAYDLMPTVCTQRSAKRLNDYAKKKDKTIDVHVLVDTGMGRLGVWHQEAYGFVEDLYKLKNLRIMGIFTHFPAADTDKAFTKKQINDLYQLVIKLDEAGMVIPYIHAANSMGLAGYETNILNLARPGLMLYGLYPHSSLKKEIVLKPAFSVKSKIIFLKEVKKGRSISYGRTFFTKKNMIVATIPIGYNDGYFRAFSNKAHVLVSGIRCPVIGRVTMDQTMIDVSHVKNVKMSSPIVLLGKQKDAYISADELAGYASTIHYEVICSLGNRLPRIFK